VRAPAREGPTLAVTSSGSAPARATRTASPHCPPSFAPTWRDTWKP
jgi:hypothetical protein